MVPIVIVVSALLSFFLLQIFIPILRHSLLDHPNNRSSHNQPTPRGGGGVFVFISLLSSFLALLNSESGYSVLGWLPLLISPLALVGFLDDCYELSASLRYCIQLLVALLIVFASPLISIWLTIPFLVIAITAVINFTNFMDGLDGLLAGCMAVTITCLAIQLSAPWTLWSLIGSLLGFLFWNWSPAKVFMGDVGSTFLGALYSALLLQASSWQEAFGFLLLATPVLGDSLICVLRRLLNGHRVFKAHRLHLFQRLHQAGWPHARVSSLYIAATAVLAIIFFLGGLPWLISLAAFELLLGIWLDQQVAVPFAVSSRH